MLIIADKLSGISDTFNMSCSLLSLRITGCGKEETKPTRASLRLMPAPSVWPRSVPLHTNTHTHIPVRSVILEWGECWEAGRWRRVPSENRAGALAGRKVSSHRDGLYTDQADL